MDKKVKNKKIANELLNDAFWLGYILELQKDVPDYGTKEVLSSFLVFFSSVFCEAVIEAKLADTVRKKVSLAEISNLRMHNLKYSPSEKSSTTKTTVNTMGVDFNNYVFDMYLLLNNNDIVDINFRNWDIYNNKNPELMNSVASSPPKWVETFLPGVFDEFMKIADEVFKLHLKRFNEQIINRKSYATSSLFKKTNIANNDKLYILQRYGLIKTIKYIEGIITEDMSLSIGDINISYQSFIMKIKAIVIEMFWNDSSDGKFTLLDEIFNMNKQSIDKKFYSINRKCRNNLHYNDYHILSKKDREILAKYQDLYLDNVITVFNKNITYKFGFGYKFALSLAKLDHWSKS